MAALLDARGVSHAWTATNQRLRVLASRSSDVTTRQFESHFPPAMSRTS